MATRPDALEPFVWKRHTFVGKRWTRNRLVRSFLLAVPWINLLALACLLWIVGRETLVQPGRVMTLAQASLKEGLPATVPTALLRRIDTPGREGETALFLEDEGRFQEDRPEELAEALQTTLDGRPIRALNLIADATIPNGTLMRWVERLQQNGVEVVNLVHIPEGAEGDVAAAEH